MLTNATDTRLFAFGFFVHLFSATNNQILATSSHYMGMNTLYHAFSVLTTKNNQDDLTNFATDWELRLGIFQALEPSINK